jgi:uncharacterized protein YciI
LPTRQALAATGRFERIGLVPTDAWLECLVNAVIHRSYSVSGDHIRIEPSGEGVAPGRVVGAVPGPEPLLALLSRSVGPRLGIDPALHLLLDAVVPDGGGGGEPVENVVVGQFLEERAVWGVHFEHLQRLLAEGILVLAGPTLGPVNTGICVFETPDETAVLEVMNCDPVVAGGFARGELRPFVVALLRGRAG